MLLPASALETLSRLDVQYPMMFRATNPATEQQTHIGVMEFSANEGHCVMPHWVMDSLSLNEGDLVTLTNVALPKATFTKIRPMTKDFIELSNPKAM